MIEKAAIDISTGHAVDSAFRSELKDPWAPTALRTFVDAAVNHQSLCWPRPSAAAATVDVDDSKLPAVFAECRKPEWGLIAPHVGPTADTVTVDAEEVRHQLQSFITWLYHSRSNLSKLRAWLQLHFEHSRIANAHSDTVPRHLVAEFDLPFALLSKEVNFRAAGLEYAFDVFVRGIAYNTVCGHDVAYFPHPLRNPLSPSHPSILFQQQAAWSWGGYVAKLAREEASTYGTMRAVLELTQAIRSRCIKGATWYDLADASPRDQLLQVECVASECGLPAKLKDDLQKVVGHNVRALSFLGPAAGLIAGAAADPSVGPLVGICVGVLVGAGTYKTGESAKGYLPRSVSGLRVLRGRLEWPGLWNEDRD